MFLPTDFIETNRWFWHDRLGYALEKCYLTRTPREKRALIEVVGRKFAWLRTVVGGKYRDPIDACIEVCKGFTEQEVEDFVMTIMDRMAVTFPERRNFMSWAQAREMAKCSISFGSHSCGHKILTRLPPSELWEEICRSRDTIAANGLNDIRVFCYPNGDYSDQVIGCLQHAGYRAAVTTKFGIEGAMCRDPFVLKRVGVHNDICSTIPMFTFHLAGLNNRGSSWRTIW